MMYPPATVSPEAMANRVLHPQGGYVSKGTTAAFITYVKALDGLDRHSNEYSVLSDRIRELKPALRAVGIFDVLSVRDPEIAAILGV